MLQYFVCVNFNNNEYTIKLIESIKSQSVEDFSKSIRLIVVDNSTNKSEAEKLKMLLNDYSWVQYIRSSGNVGYFPALNIGLGYIDKSTASFIIICNNDIVLGNKFCSTLDKVSFPSNAYVLCPSVLTQDGVYQNPSLSKPPSRWRVFLYDLYYSNFYFAKIMMVLRGLGTKKRVKDYNDREIFIGIGAFYVLTKPFFQHNEELDYPLFLYGEEAFLSQQVRKSGGIVYYLSNDELQIIHSESVTTSKLPSRDKFQLTQASYRKYRGFYVKS